MIYYMVRNAIAGTLSLYSSHEQHNTKFWFPTRTQTISEYMQFNIRYLKIGINEMTLLLSKDRHLWNLSINEIKSKIRLIETHSNNLKQLKNLRGFVGPVVLYRHGEKFI